MRHRIVLAALGAALLVAGERSAQAQWWPGWGGGATTVGGDVSRGMGVFAAGVGEYNVNTAEATAINANTRMQWNNYQWAVAQSLYQDYNRRLIAQNKESARNIAELNKRLRENPTSTDIMGGRALNAILDDFQHPMVQSEALKISERRTIPGRLVKQIPFFYSSDPFTFSLNQFVGGAVQVPEVLNRPEFQAERATLRALAQQAREEDAASEGADISPETLNKLNAAAEALRTKFIQRYGPNTREYVQAEPFLKALVGFTSLLKSNSFEREVVKLKDDQQVSLFDLLTFMTVFNLRFGRAETPDARAAYNQIFPILDQRRKELVALIAQHASAPPELPAAAPPAEMFKPLDIQNQPGRTTPPPPNPSRP
jgi:hypothetical protein